MKIDLPVLYNQGDPRFSNFLLGFNTVSKYNIGQYGCLISGLAVIACYLGKNVTPIDINEALKDKKGFAPAGGNYVWGSLSKVFPDIIEKKTDTPGILTDAQMSEIKTAIDYGYLVMVQLDYDPKTVAVDTHYVVLCGYNPADENDFLIADSLGGRVHSLKDYLGWFYPSVRKTIQQYAVYVGPKPKVTENAILIRIEDNNRNVMQGSEYKLICEYFKLDPNGMQSTKILQLIADMVQSMESMTKKYNSLEHDLYKTLQDLKRQEEISKVQSVRITMLSEKIDNVPTVIPYTDIQNKRPSFIEKLLSFFVTTTEEYAKLKRKR